MLGASSIIVLVQDPRIKLGLNSAIAQYLGRISYSMYLVHYTVLFALFDLAYPTVPVIALAILCAIATLIVSHLFCIFIEEPAHAGKTSLQTATTQPRASHPDLNLSPHRISPVTNQRGSNTSVSTFL
jgi:peptidoglycan/LPS O-acetylase OafA/YrhL